MGSPTKVASSSSRGKLTEYGKRKTEKLRGQTSKSKTIGLNIVDIKDVKILRKIQEEEHDDREKVAEVVGGALAGTAVVGAIAAVVAAAVVLPMLLFVI